MKTSKRGIDLIKSFEGVRLKAYPDPATGGEPWTIGYGRAHGVRKGDVITEATADAFLAEDLASFETAVAKLCPVSTVNQFSALVSFAFNVGPDNLKISTLRRFHNEGKYKEAADQFLRWDRAAGKQMAGLTKRRRAERLLYLATDA